VRFGFLSKNYGKFMKKAKNDKKSINRKTNSVQTVDFFFAAVIQ